MEEDSKGSDNKEKIENQDEVLARRMFIKASGLSVPLVLASFTVSRPVVAQTCNPNLCNPGTSCNPDACGPDVCKPGGACNPDNCNPSGGPCGPDNCNPNNRGGKTNRYGTGYD